jgi:signal transduction histidine kinase
MSLKELLRREAKRTENLFSRVLIEKLIADSCRSLEPLAAEKGIKIRSKTSDSLPRLEADEQLLTQVINNLLSNAIKYSPAHSEITIETESDEAETRIIVRDTGYGIPEEEQERIFEKFYRLERKEDAEVVGSGLGLPLVREIVEKHGGRVAVKSVLGQGSVFTIHLPLL